MSATQDVDPPADHAQAAYGTHTNTIFSCSVKINILQKGKLISVSIMKEIRK